MSSFRFAVVCPALVLATIGGSAKAADMPPNVDRDPVVHARLEAAYAAKGAGYVPRTHLKDAGKARFVNRLIEEASPYLIQHAHNPVDWWPWSEEALAEAVARDMPIFLSVGYATCHWCHVMEEESFDNEAIAALLNAGFIAIKIDREEMPELDHLYITATQIQQGQAGWPNSVFLLPDGQPFHTGTYFPPDQFAEILQLVSAAWWDPAQRSEMQGLAGQLSDAVRQVTQMSSNQSVPLIDRVHERAAAQLLDMHNALEGGFSHGQQFPQEGYLLFLMEHWRRTGDEASLSVATETLYAIAAGGIHDQVGGGFHRYTVDPNWRTPHFEKMLYNQGLLARAFIEGWEITGEEIFRRAAERTFAYIARDMTDPDGAFYAAEDADSLNASGEREEGAFYIFTPEQMQAVAGVAAVMALGLEETPTLDAGGVIHFELGEAPDFEQVDPILETARIAREARHRPFRDEKIIAGWNGLMIRALAEGGAAFKEPRYISQAARAGETLWDRLWDGQRLHRLWAAGQSREEGALADYAWLALGYLSLADATGEAKWHVRANLLAETLWLRFGDGLGRLKMAAADGPLGPIYENSDGAVPSGESSTLELLARLSRRSIVGNAVEATDTGRAGIASSSQDLVNSALRHRARAEELSSALSAPMSEDPLLRTDALIASRIMDAGESGRRQLAAKGVVRVHLAGERLYIDIAEGWHLNAHKPGADWLIGVSLAGASATWPAGEKVSLGFAQAPIRVYDGHLEIPVSLEKDIVTLNLQACSDSICLEPETITFRLL
ncbi:MAG: DUF255 domain-containing protein [Paracoccaceae bacterium]